jgi:PBSX family phage terminase large subunit
MGKEEDGIDLQNIFIEKFYKIHANVKNTNKRMFWMPGGRGSTKSSFISLEIIICMLRWHDMNTLVIRRNANTIFSSVFSQILWAIDLLGRGGAFTIKRSPPEITRWETGQKIIFRGLDDPLKLKSIKSRVGYFGIVWFEELTEMSEESVRSVLQTVIRGGERFKIFYSYNPSKFASHWTNSSVSESHPLKIIVPSTYLDVPREWLGDAFLEEAEMLKKNNELAYRNEYLGEVTGGGGNVFQNLEIKNISNDDIENNCDSYLFGVDWGFAISPLCIVVCAWNKSRRELRIIEEVFGRNISNEAAAGHISRILKKYSARFGSRVFADSAEPKSIDYMRRLGLPMEPCVKGPDSIRYGVRYLQDLSKIIIDPERCPCAARQFQNYEYQKNRMGEWIDSYPSLGDDAIDATRYATTGIANSRVTIFGN